MLRGRCDESLCASASCHRENGEDVSDFQALHYFLAEHPFYQLGQGNDGRTWTAIDFDYRVDSVDRMIFVLLESN